MGLERRTYYPPAAIRSRKGPNTRDLVRWIGQDFDQAADYLAPTFDLFNEYWKLYLTEQRRDAERWQSNAVSPWGGYAVRQLVPLIKRPILTNRPMIQPRARKPELVPLEALLAKQLDYWLDLARVRRVVLTDQLAEGLIFGAGFAKAYHATRTRPVTRMVPVVTSTGEAVFDTAGNPRMRPVQDEEPYYDGPAVRLVPMGSAYWDPTASVLEEADFFIHRFFKLKSELLGDPTYDGDAVQRCVGSKSAAAAPRYSISIDEMFEVERRRRIGGLTRDEWQRKIETVASRGDGVVECLELISGGSKYTIGNRTELISEQTLDVPFPVWAIVPIPVPGEILGKSIYHDALPTLDERDYVAGLMYDNMAQVVHQMSKGIPGLFDEDSIEPRPGGVVLVSNMAAFERLQATDIVGSAFAVMTHLDRDAQRALGLPEPISGVGAGAGTVYPETAHGVTRKEENALLPIAEMVSHVEQGGLYPMARIIFDQELEHTTKEDWVALAGEQGALWENIDLDTLASEIDFQILGSSQAMAREIEMAAMQQGSAIVLKIAELTGGGGIDLLELGRRALRALAIQDVEKIIPGERTDLGPDAEHMAMERGLPVVPTVDEDLQEHLTAHHAALRQAVNANTAETNPMYIQRLIDHIKLTERRLRQMEAQAQMALAQQQGAGPPARGGGGPSA